ncbi:MAG: peptide MFS transporter [Planctomycetota bacterium]
MWERFSYYGMRALLVFYLTKHWFFTDSESGVIYGAYTALVYITPVLGGYLADRYLGQRKAVLYGAVLLTVGHVLMGVEGSGAEVLTAQSPPAVEAEAAELAPAALEAAQAAGIDSAMAEVARDATILNVFWLALAFIIVGSGFLKANISVIVGQLYPRADTRRDGAYTIFYMGINLGAFLGSLLCGWLGETYGWSYGFGAAGIGMLLGLVVFVIGKPLLMGRGEPPRPEELKRSSLGLPFEWLLYLWGLVAVVVCWYLVQNQALVGSLLGISGLALVAYVISTAVMKLDAIERNRIFAALFLIVCSILFWALFEQAGSSLNLLTDRLVDREIFGQEVPASTFQSINAIYIILLAPVLAGLWTFMGRKGIEPSAPMKFGLGMIQLGGGFLVLVLGAQGAGADGLIPVLFIFLIYLLHTTGELCLSPVGLSAMNKLAPAYMASLIMGTWFFASATGNFVAGLIASAIGSGALESEGEGLGSGYMETVIEVYSNIGWVAVGVGVGIMIVSPLVKRMMHLDSLGEQTA